MYRFNIHFIEISNTRMFYMPEDGREITGEMYVKSKLNFFSYLPKRAHEKFDLMASVGVRYAGEQYIFKRRLNKKPEVTTIVLKGPRSGDFIGPVLG